MDTMVAWIRRYIKHSPHSSRPDVKRHGPFYSACQAVFYVFVFRHEDILQTYGESSKSVSGWYEWQFCLANFFLGVSWRRPHHRQELATLRSVGANF